jgi:nucleotide-binding universal stress UspA family protein
MRPDVLLLTTHGRGAASSARLGTVADTVARGATCDTLVIGSRMSRHRADFRSILVPLDGSKLAEQALNVAADVRSVHPADLHLVQAVQVPVPAGAAIESTSASLARSKAVSDASGYLDKVASTLGAVRTHAEPGPANEVILRYVQREGIELIVMTTHGAGPLNSMAVGGETDRLLGGPAPVLIVRPSA